MKAAMTRKIIILAVAVGLGGCITSQAPSQEGSKNNNTSSGSTRRLMRNPPPSPPAREHPHFRILKLERVRENFYRLQQ